LYFNFVFCVCLLLQDLLHFDICFNVCVFITAVSIAKLFARGRGIVEDMCYERQRAEACVD
jgi:hypothetical protein